MSTAILTPKTNAAKAYLRAAAGAATTNTALGIATVILACALVGMCGYVIHVARSIVAEKPLVVRVEQVGRAEAVNLNWDEYRPQDSDMKYFLTQFVAGFYSRNRHTVQDVYPAVLHFLREDLYQSVNANDRRTKWLAKFLNSSDEEVQVEVTNVALDRGMQPSYRAQVDARKVIISPGGYEQKVIPFVVTIWFQVKPELVRENQDLIKYNPLGFLIDSFRADDAFGTTKNTQTATNREE